MQFHGKAIEVKTLIEIIHERLFFSEKPNFKIQSFSYIFKNIINELDLWNNTKVKGHFFAILHAHDFH